jgi:hypothetical protein
VRLTEAAINGMLNRLDPHSSYMDAKSFKDMQIQTRGELGGLGIEITVEDGLVKVAPESSLSQGIPQMITIVSRSVFLRPHRQRPANQTASFQSQMIPVTPEVSRRTLRH